MSVDHISHDKAGSIKKGGSLLLKGQPCRVVEIHKSKTGKHGSAKIRFVGLDIFTRRKYEDLMPSSESVEVPEVRKYDLKVTTMTGKQVTGTTPDGRKISLPLPSGKQMEDFVEELEERIRDRKPTICIVAQALGKQAIVGLKGFSADSDDDTHPDFEDEQSDEEEDNSDSE